ncbi:polysaccharide biosynthesis protein [Aliikangiella coralliicola]|uniref:Polysaccharide biosynthesis protein n=1 Tax=Aliikangiella coralliicola TaxID=2592383 RepID=A0A545UHE4_9GAMM|nr:polysaccharide biosynthesis protein [Aliikangiella coralliicola]TQV88879.1 polysaccharide biosynthesis protein [Aliikangiella coralliicola]
MSIIESAYLKSKKDKGDALDEEKREEILAPGGEFSVPRKKEAQDLVSSRKEISRMSQEAVFEQNDYLSKRLIFSNMPDTILLNKYRNLRTRLLATSETENFVTLVTSVLPGGGSSLVAANLATTFAFDEAKTAMLIDANIHHPTLNSLLEVNAEKGLIDYLESEDWKEDEILYETRIPRLRFVPSGLVRENSAEYFTSERMKSFMHHLVSRYPDRYPIIDAPSIAYSADTQILTELCDKVILVVKYGQCSEEEIRKAALAIGREKFAGIVLNQF